MPGVASGFESLLFWMLGFCRRLSGWCNTGSLTVSESTCVAAVLVFLLALRRHSDEGGFGGYTGLAGGPIVHGCSGCRACRAQMGHSSFHPHSAPRRLFVVWTRSPLVFSLSPGSMYHLWGVSWGQPCLFVLFCFACVCSRHVLRCMAVFVFVGACPSMEACPAVLMLIRVCVR